MFRVEDNVPEVYVQESRDFQLMSRLYDLVFQSTRFSIDSMVHASDTIQCNSSLLNNLSTKIGFFSNLNVTDKELRTILSAFPHIIKHKGTMYGFNLIMNVFNKLSNSDLQCTYSYTSGLDANNLKIDPHISITYDIASNINFELLLHLIEYVRPAGCRIVFGEPSFSANDLIHSIEVTSNVTKYYNIPETSESTGVVVTVGEVEEGSSNIGFTQTQNKDSYRKTDTKEEINYEV